MKRYRIIWSEKPTAKLIEDARRIATKYAEVMEAPLWISCGGFLLLRRDAVILEIPEFLAEAKSSRQAKASV